MNDLLFENNTEKEDDFKVILFDENYHNEFIGWITEKDKGVYISLIVSKDKGKGNFSNLLKELKIKYDFIKITCPSNQMVKICVNKGFNYSFEYDKDLLEYVPILKWSKNEK